MTGTQALDFLATVALCMIAIAMMMIAGTLFGSGRG